MLCCGVLCAWISTVSYHVCHVVFAAVLFIPGVDAARARTHIIHACTMHHAPCTMHHAPCTMHAPPPPPACHRRATGVPPTHPHRMQCNHAMQCSKAITPPPPQCVCLCVGGVSRVRVVCVVWHGTTTAPPDPPSLTAPYPTVCICFDLPCTQRASELSEPTGHNTRAACALPACSALCATTPAACDTVNTTLCVNALLLHHHHKVSTACA